MNLFKTVFLMSLMTGLFLVVGALIGGGPGMVIAFVMAAGMNLLAWWNSDKMLLSMYGAKQVDASSAPDLFHIVERLAGAARLPMPKVYISENPQPNAFATGRDPAHAAVCVTSGLLATVSKEELAGVIAHELGHVKNRDTLTMTITAVIAGAIGMLANFAFFMGDRRNPLGLVGVLLVTMLAPVAAMLVQAAISRSREFEADKAGAERGYREALKMKPDLDAAATNLGALLVEAGKVDDAITVLKGAIARRPDAGELRLNLAVALAQKGDQAAATKEFDEAVKLQGKDPIYLVTYAQWLGQWKQTDAAVAKLKAASALAGQDVGVLASIGFEMKNVGAFADCVTVLDKAVGLKDAAELRTYRALCKLGNKDKAGSLADLEAAVKKEPSYGPAHFYLGGRYADAGKWAEVIQEYEAYLKIEPKGPLAKQAEERIKLAKTKLKK